MTVPPLVEAVTLPYFAFRKVILLIFASMFTVVVTLTDAGWLVAVRVASDVGAKEDGFRFSLPDGMESLLVVDQVASS